MRQRIALEWIYESKQPVSSMVFTRFMNSADHKDPFISTELNLVTVHINGTNEKKVSLILENPIHIDYDLQYNCQVNCGDPLPRNNLPIELRALRPKWTDYEVGKIATLGQDVTFMWEYKYPFKATAVLISRGNNSNSEMVKIGYWYQDKFTDNLGQFINRANVTKTPNEDQTGEKISLTLKNVTVEDFGWEYVCQLTLGDGEQLLTRTTLKEIEMKSNTVMSSKTHSRTSTAARSTVDYSTIMLLVIVTSVISHISQDYTSIKMETAVLLMLVIPVTTDSVFEWKNTTNPVISIMRQRIALEWKYESKEPVSSMVFTRFRNSPDHKVPVGKWTKEEGFKPDPFISTKLNLVTVHINGTNEKKVSLILENPIHIDYDLQYNCQVNCGDPLPRNNMSIELRALKPKWTDYEVGKNATLGQDVTFMWEYKYPFKAIAVFIRRENNSNSEMVEIGYWYQDKFTDLGQFINRANVTKTPNEDQTGEKISLTLKNVTVEDFGWEYVCQLTLGDGEQLLTRTTLKDVEVKPNTVTPKTDSRTSTAARSTVDYSTIILLVIVTPVISHISQD